MARAAATAATMTPGGAISLAAPLLGVEVATPEPVPVPVRAPDSVGRVMVVGGEPVPVPAILVVLDTVQMGFWVDFTAEDVSTVVLSVDVASTVQDVTELVVISLVAERAGQFETAGSHRVTVRV